jgi:apolipoprotein N-acyltransferase
MIPGIEAVDVPGTTRTILNKPSGIWGIEICKDMDFPGLSRQYGASGVALLLVPAWDFRIDGWLHGRMAVMRGVESGFTIARAASEGRLSISDDRGRVLAEQSAAIRFPTLYLNTPVRHVNTLYARWGDWFGWLSVVVLLLILFIPIRK